MKIGFGQINTRAGDISANAQKILRACDELSRSGADFAVFPEGAISGLPAKDFTFYKKFVELAQAALAEIASKAPLPLFVSCPRLCAGAAGVRIGAYLVEGGEAKLVCDKILLPNYGALNDPRNFDSGENFGVAELCGKRIALTVCEDIWTLPEIPTAARYAEKQKPLDYFASGKAGKIDLLVNMSASVFSFANDNVRGKEKMLCKVSKFVGAPVAWCNAVGGNDSLVFAGAGAYVDATGASPKSECLPKFAECAKVIDTEKVSGFDGDSFDFSGDADLLSASVLALRDFAEKCAFPRVIIGLSGGIDSALVAALAVEALGAERVIGISMPSRISSEHSKGDARALAENLGIEFHTVGIADIVESAEKSLSPLFAGMARGVAEENIQSRARGLVLMAISNKFGGAVLTTGNKSECSVGYCTLYGDTCGAFAPICDLYKTEVYRLSRLVNERAGREIIPQNTIDKPPSAELRPDQKDEDSLPPYDVLDAILRLHIEGSLSAPEIAARGFDAAVVGDVLGKVARAEYKRSQYPIGPKLSAAAYGADRILPVAAKSPLI